MLSRHCATLPLLKYQSCRRQPKPSFAGFQLFGNHLNDLTLMKSVTKNSIYRRDFDAMMAQPPFEIKLHDDQWEITKLKARKPLLDGPTLGLCSEQAAFTGWRLQQKLGKKYAFMMLEGLTTDMGSWANHFYLVGAPRRTKVLSRLKDFVRKLDGKSQRLPDGLLVLDSSYASSQWDGVSLSQSKPNYRARRLEWDFDQGECDAGVSHSLKFEYINPSLMQFRPPLPLGTVSAVLDANQDSFWISSKTPGERTSTEDIIACLSLIKAPGRAEKPRPLWLAGFPKPEQGFEDCGDFIKTYLKRTPNLSSKFCQFYRRVYEQLGLSPN